MTEAMPFLQNYDITFLRPPPIGMVFLFGAGDEARTRYLDLGKVALYQMSYARRTMVIIVHNMAIVKDFFHSFRIISIIPQASVSG